MTIVIDVGAARYGGDYSMERLIDQFSPTLLYAIDPNPALAYPEGYSTKWCSACEADALNDPCVCGEPEGKTVIELINEAAWIRPGTVGYRADGLNSWLTNDPGAPDTPCFDLAHFIVGLSEKSDDEIILKLDCEGSEYELLDWIISNDADELLKTVIVEWHPKSEADHEALSASILERLRCEYQEWPY